MEHAFLDLDEDDPSNDEWTFQGKNHSDKVRDKRLFRIFFSNSCLQSCANFIVQLLENLNDLRKQSVFCDVVIKAGDKEFPVHKCVLSAVSNYFKVRKKVVSRTIPHYEHRIPYVRSLMSCSRPCSPLAFASQPRTW